MLFRSTYPAINAARFVAVLVMGAAKGPMLKRVAAAKDDYLELPILGIEPIGVAATTSQEEILALEVPAGRQPLSERALRRLTESLLWTDQRAMWRALRARP